MRPTHPPLHGLLKRVEDRRASNHNQSVRALLAVTLLLAVAAGGATSNPVFRREDGSAIVFPGAVRAWCDRDGLHALNLAHSLRQSHWQLDVARTQVRSNHAVD